MLSYFLAVCFLIITPGPGVLTTAGAGAAFGFRAGLAYMWGVIIGSLLVMAAVITGLAALVFSYPPVRNLLLAASLAYLLYIAYRIATAGNRVAIMEAERPLGFVNGLALSVINPKAYAVHTALFSGFAFMPEALVLETVLKFAIMNAIWIPIHLAWLAAGVTLRRLDLAPRLHRAINIGMALAMLAVVGLTASSALGGAGAS